MLSFKKSRSSGRKLALVLLVLCSITSLYSQQFHSVDGIEDEQGNTLLLYRVGQQYFPFNPVYKLNTNSLDESLLIQAFYSVFPGGDLAKAVNDFEFFPDDVNNFINVGFEINPDNHSYIARNDTIVFGGFDGFERVDISKQNPQKVFVFSYNYTLRSYDGGYTFPLDSSSGPGVYSPFWISKFDDEILFGLNVDNQLMRNSEIVDTSRIFLNEHTKLIFDINQFHVYRANRTYWGYSFNVSNNKGNAFTWTKTYQSENPIYVAIDSTQSGVLYLVDGRKIYKSVNNGYSFNEYKSLPSKLVGIYKKPNSEILYAASKNMIFKVTPDSITIIKSLPFPEEEYGWFPLAVGNKWAFNSYWSEENTGYPPTITFAGTKFMEVVKDTMIQSKNYFVVENNLLTQMIFERRMFLRIDSTSGLVYRYWEDLNGEFLFHSLNAEVGDTIPYPLFPEEPYYILMSEEPISFLDNETFIRNYIENLPCGCGHSLIRGYGLASAHFNEFGGSDDYLKGCVINGVLYGDTTYVVDVEEEQNPIPTEYRLEQNYPNPFNPSTKISWQLPISSWVTLKIFDALGREVETLVNEYQNSGNHSTFYPSGINSTLPSGIYFYQLTAGEFVETKKMMFLK